MIFFHQKSLLMAKTLLSSHPQQRRQWPPCSIHTINDYCSASWALRESRDFSSSHMEKEGKVRERLQTI